MFSPRVDPLDSNLFLDWTLDGTLGRTSNPELERPSDSNSLARTVRSPNGVQLRNQYRALPRISGATVERR